jgi:hypothetical protein
LLELDLRRQVGDLVFGRLAVGDRLVERGAQVAVVDPGQHLASLDRLVVVDRHLGDVTGNLGRDDGGIRPDIGVIRRHLEPADLPVLDPVFGRQTHCDGGAGADQRPLQRQQPVAVARSGDDAGCALQCLAHGDSLLDGQQDCPWRR